jgi:hypothetical protein
MAISQVFHFFNLYSNESLIIEPLHLRPTPESHDLTHIQSKTQHIVTTVDVYGDENTPLTRSRLLHELLSRLRR